MIVWCTDEIVLVKTNTSTSEQSRNSKDKINDFAMGGFACVCLFLKFKQFKVFKVWSNTILHTSYSTMNQSPSTGAKKNG